MKNDKIKVMFKKKSIISYESAIDYTDNSLFLAKNFIPEWYKKIPKYKEGHIYDMEKGFSPSIKLCVPFLDALTSGYMLTLPYDVYVKNNKGAPFLVCPPEIPETQTAKWRSEIAHEKIVPSGCYPYEYTWNFCISFTVPVGYSILLTHPFNRHDLPFTTMTGIIDGGLVVQSGGSFPFYIKKDFEGIIPQGTPIAQLIPFRQEKWKSKKQLGLVKEGVRHRIASLAMLYGWYKKTFWVKKQYN